MSFFTQINFHGDNNIGLYGIATDSFCLLGIDNKKINQQIKSVLKAPVYKAQFLDINLAKLFTAGNSAGIVLPSMMPKQEIDDFRKEFDFKIKVIDTNYALGNFILMNDKGIVISDVIKKHKNEIEKFFSLDVVIGKISKLNLVGSLGIATNKGCLLHPDVLDKEASLIEKSLDVPVNIGTVSFGSHYPGAGIIANSNGFITSRTTSGPEMGRITEALGFL
ncbi:MAG: translation initiation factor IF-6 [Candidatus Aenigmarchaeota archaeon]|nr:translation initiation factor IF-6 [Candidatus Aenigmarchaeota archaeon]